MIGNVRAINHSSGCLLERVGNGEIRIKISRWMELQHDLIAGCNVCRLMSIALMQNS